MVRGMLIAEHDTFGQLASIDKGPLLATGAWVLGLELGRRVCLVLEPTS